MEPLVTLSGGERGRGKALESRTSVWALASLLPGASLWNKRAHMWQELKAAGPSLFGTRDQFHGRQFHPRLKPRGQTHSPLDPGSFREKGVFRG